MNHELQKAAVLDSLLRQAGARECLIVGGFVRDRLMGIPCADVDMEVYGLNYSQIVNAISNAGFSTDLVGKAFGIVKVDNYIDVSVPRRENKRGVGHKDFEINHDPNMTAREAAARRDFTINSIAMTINGEIIDPFGGEADLRAGILKATSNAFSEDPLRVLRGMQFAGRFGFVMDAKTIRMSVAMKDEYKHLPKERVFSEWHKWAVKSRYPSKALALLLETRWVENFPELNRLVGLEQEKEWHPEGDVYSHTGCALDAAIGICNRRGFTSEQREAVMFGVLGHDFGKATTTTTVMRHGIERIISHRHAAAGRTMVLNFMDSIKSPLKLREIAAILTAEHMSHISRRKDKLTERMVRRLAVRLHPATIDLWAAVCESDASGRHPLPPTNPVAQWEEAAVKLCVQANRPKPILMGRHLITEGYEPGVEMGKLLDAAFEAQLDGEFIDLNSALEFVHKQQQKD